MGRTKINNPNELIKLIKKVDNQRIQDLERKIEFHKISIENLSLQLAREIDRECNKKNNSGLHFPGKGRLKKDLIL